MEMWVDRTFPIFFPTHTAHVATSHAQTKAMETYEKQTLKLRQLALSTNYVKKVTKNEKTSKTEKSNKSAIFLLKTCAKSIENNYID